MFLWVLSLSLKISDLFYYFALLHGIFSGKTEYQTTKTNKARRSASFERRPSKRYSRRTLQMKGKRTSLLRSTVQSENQVIMSFKNSGRNSPVVVCPSLECSKLGFLWLIEETSCIYQKKLVYKAHPNQLAWQVKHPWNLHSRSWYEDGKFGPRKQWFINDSVLN